MNYIINIIGIDNTGKKVLDELKDTDYKQIIESSNNIIINKLYYKGSMNIDSKESWFNFIVYDNKNKDIASNIADKLSNVEFLNIGICINGNDDIPNIKVLETNIEDASCIILNMLQPILNLPGLIGYDIYDIYNYLNTNSKYEIINFKNQFIDSNKVISYLEKYNNTTIEPMIVLSTTKCWTLAKQSDFLNKIWNLKYINSEIKWHLYFTDYINKDLLTIIIKHSN